MESGSSKGAAANTEAAAGRKGEIRFTDTKQRQVLEIVVPAGTSHKDLGKVTLADLLSKFRPSGCQACLSGQDFIIRERFDRVLPVEINGGKFNF